jgi:glutathionylspermidine synthase
MAFNTAAYLEKWEAINDKMRDSHFLWGSLFHDGEWNQYMSLDVYKIQQNQWDILKIASTEICQVLQTTYNIIYNNTEYLLQLGLPESALDLITVESDYFSDFIRLDLVINNNEIKILEINSDTPSGWVEGSIANRILCEEIGCVSPNNLEQLVEQAWRKILQKYQIQESETIYFTAYNWHDEDRETTQFFRRHCPHKRTEFVEIGKIIVTENGVYSPTGAPIRFLYRLYPLEYLDEDVDATHQPIGRWLTRHIVEGRIKIINPPSAFIMQSKAVMALIYQLFLEHSPLFSNEEHRIIEQYFLPTYFNPSIFIEQNQAFVAKPLWGREGGGVTIYDKNQRVIQEDRTLYYYEQPKIYQQFTPLPKLTVGTWDGDYEGHLLTGVFVVQGEPAGVLLRIGEPIIGNLSMFCGIAIEN